MSNISWRKYIWRTIKELYQLNLQRCRRNWISVYKYIGFINCVI